MLPLPCYDRPRLVHPPLHWPDHRSTASRAPDAPPVILPQNLTEVTGPLLDRCRVSDLDAHLTRPPDGEPLAQRTSVHGRVVDSDGGPVPDALLEIWQANAAGRYRHEADRWRAPLDPNFTGAGRTISNSEGYYRFVTIRPGAYPWGNHHNAWRPAHIHFSLLGRAFAQRLVTQMYFPDDPLFFQDPIFNAVRDERARALMISEFDYENTMESWAMAYKWDIILRRTPMEGE